jgi:hypothetical protein
MKKIKVGGEGDKGQEVIVRYETAHRRKGRSTWNWHEEFALEWSQTFITKKKGRNLK